LNLKLMKMSNSLNTKKRSTNKNNFWKKKWIFWQPLRKIAKKTLN